MGGGERERQRDVRSAAAVPLTNEHTHNIATKHLTGSKYNTLDSGLKDSLLATRHAIRNVPSNPPIQLLIHNGGSVQNESSLNKSIGGDEDYKRGNLYGQHS